MPTVSMSPATVACPFCNQNSRTGSCSEIALLDYFDCDICGSFFITQSARANVQAKKNITPGKLNCIAENISINTPSNPICWQLRTRTADIEGTVSRYVEDVEGYPIVHAEKPQLILKMAASKLRNVSPFESAGFVLRDIYSLRILGFAEFVEWVQSLHAEGLVVSRTIIGDTHPSFKITAVGWKRIEELFAGVRSTSVFIAMSFGLADKEKTRDSIRQACKEMGWDAATVDEQEYLGGVTDKIISEIRQARFVVCDFTGNNRGVYYEAGYAHGLNVPVIYTVKEEQLTSPNAELKLHFDTQSINHLAWKDHADLIHKLKNRIGAVIGKSSAESPSARP